MNERDKELAKKALEENDWDEYVNLGKFASLIRADEREQIADKWWEVVQYDLENGIKSLNEQTTIKWRKEYPLMASFGEWLETKGNLNG